MEAIPAMRELFQMDRQNYNPEGKVYKRPSARAVILKDGKVLLNYLAKYDCYEFPGGGIETGEMPEDAVQREVAEETGRIVVPESIRVFGIVMDTLIVRARKADATFFDCYNHYERYTHPMQFDCPVVTPEARVLWDIKTESTDRFMEQYRKDILLGGENYIGYR